MLVTSKIVQASRPLSRVLIMTKKSVLMLSLMLYLFGANGSFTETLAQRQTHLIANGDSVFATSCNAGCVTVLLSRVGSGKNVRTLLIYNYSRYDSLLGVYLNEFGSGMIPNEDFKAPGIKITHHVLDTDTTNNPNIEATSSSFNPITGESIVLPTNRGRINFEFEKNGQFSTSQIGSTVIKLTAVTIRTIGSSESATAGFKGSFFGTAIEARDGGSIGTNHQTTLILER